MNPFHNIPLDDFNDYRWQLKNSFSTIEELDPILHLTDDEKKAITLAASSFPTHITPHYLSLMDKNLANNCPIRKQAIPISDEFAHHLNCNAMDDPLSEETHCVAPALTQRYPDRVLLYTTHACATHCRHCTRRRKVSNPSQSHSFPQLLKSIEYIKNNPQIRDCLVSGGDPLMLPNHKINTLLSTLRKIEHLDIIRLCTRMPVTLPQRFFDPELLDIIKQNSPLFISTHFNHPNEASKASEIAIKNIRQTGSTIVNQTVLLKGINDDPMIIEKLNRWLLKNGVHPYCLFQLDLTRGTQHFKTPLSTGLKIIKHLRSNVSGLATPQFIVDLPDGNGKIALNPDPILKKNGNEITFLNWEGKPTNYTDIDP